MLEFLGCLFVCLMLLSIVHQSIFFSIFFLIALFFCSSFLFILLGFEFIGFLYLIVYVGAVAVLFLFMVMLFDKSEYLFFYSDTHEGFLFKFFYQALGLVVAFSHFFALTFLLDFTSFSFVEGVDLIESNHIFFAFGSNLQRIGLLLYTYFFFALLGGAMVLLVGMVGAIVLTQRFFFVESHTKHQNIKDQILRKRV
jgi:NADH-quinone oxidoreductase subunit J